MVNWMKKYKIKGMHCASCEKLLKMELGEIAGVAGVKADWKKGELEIDGNISDKQVADAVEKAGYSIDDGSKKGGFGAFIGSVLSGSAKEERKLSVLFLLATFALLSLSAVFYLLFLRSLPNFGERFPFLLYAAVSSAALIASIFITRAYSGQLTCMEGMMAGMTVGMVAGFLFGAIIGATNGMFIGSVFGMFVGILAGAYVGSFTGVMGVMEGMMAGLMGGTMGAMITVMMVADHLTLFMPIFVLSCLAIVAGLFHMLNSYAGRRGDAKGFGTGAYLLLSVLLYLLTFAVMLLAPRAGLVI